MTWRGAALHDDQRDLTRMLDALAEDRNRVLDDEDEDAVAALVQELAGLGIWTLGADEAAGGGGADDGTTALALERLGRHWPGLGWAAGQAHAAVTALAGQQSGRAIVEGLHSGTDAVAVVHGASSRVHLSWQDGRLVGTVDRVDAAHPAPHLLVLTGDSTAVLVRAGAMSVTPLETTGLGGSLTRRLDVDVPEVEVQVLEDVPAAAALVRLSAAAAAVATGVAGAAADAALEYARTREQFGGPLTAIPTVRETLFAQTARVTTFAHTASSATGDLVQAAAAAVQACDAAVDTAASALQSHGGYGYLAEYPVERMLRDAVSLRAATDTLGTGAVAAATLCEHPTTIELQRDVP